MDVFGSIGVNNIHGAALQRDNDATVIVAVQAERSVRNNERLPDTDIGVFELVLAAGLEGRRRLLRSGCNAVRARYYYAEGKRGGHCDGKQKARV
jgi:hypothetical protein